jgi:hypothetical protein
MVLQYPQQRNKTTGNYPGNVTYTHLFGIRLPTVTRHVHFVAALEIGSLANKGCRRGKSRGGGQGEKDGGDRELHGCI